MSEFLDSLDVKWKVKVYPIDNVGAILKEINQVNTVGNPEWKEGYKYGTDSTEIRWFISKGRWTRF